MMSRGVRKWFPWGKDRGRLAGLADNNLGIISLSAAMSKSQMALRNPVLDLYDAYYERRQYAGLAPWDQTEADDKSYVPVRKRQPRLNYGFAKVLTQRIVARLFGAATFPSIKTEDDPDTNDFIRLILRASQMRYRILEPARRMLVTGSVFVRFYIVDGAFMVEHYLSKYCFPIFSASGQLQSVKVRYLWADLEDLDSKGEPKMKWYQMELGEMTDVLYDTPEYREGQSAEEVAFEVVAQADHNLGFVQGEWFRTCEQKHTADGYSLISDVLEFIDEMNYSLSQSSQAVSYNQDPQLVVNGMDEDEVEKLIKSSTKAWMFGKDGKGEFLESSLNGVTIAGELRDKVTKSIGDLARVVFLDPEKMAAQAQSGKAMEVLNQPFVDLIHELRPAVEPPMISLTLKMMMANLMLAERGIPVPIETPRGWRPKSLDITATWPPVFQQTMKDLQEKVMTVGTATDKSLISRETGTRFLAADFNVEDIDAEIARIAAQPVLNPFGSF